MKKVLIIHAHPESQSFCSSLKNEAVSYFQSQGAEVKVSDLYAMGFNPVGDKHDFKQLQNPDFFKYQMEQVHAHQNNLFMPDVKTEMDKLEWCDTLIFNFPLWWFGLPAILKGWVDRIFAMGLVYGAGKGVYDNGTYKNKTAFLTLTTGGPEVAYGDTGKNGNLDTILYPIQHGMFYFAGMTVLPPFISFSPARITDEERKTQLALYKSYLEKAISLKPIYKA
ncbi:MAG: NAD(P)H-dependent oxidoreductase [Bacteroidetes bacterium]|nr:NAD(P)H-dependent oxidoreductase [Bacteroidota bacterium]